MKGFRPFSYAWNGALKAIKQQHHHAMTEQEGEHHLKDHLFHGLRSNIQNVLHYMYDKPNSQYSKLVMAAREAETETPGSGVSEARAKLAVVELDTLRKANSSEPPYEAMGDFLKQKPKGQRKIRRICTVRDVEVLDMGGGN